jgi:NifU-like protein involved in Fe-S cluster formation
MDYSSDVRRRFSAPARAGATPLGAGEVVEGAAEDRSLSVWVRFQVQLQGARIERVRYRAFGCPHTLAAADWIAGVLEGQSMDALKAIDLRAMARQVGLPREKHGKLLRIEDALAACYAQACRLRREKD